MHDRMMRTGKRFAVYLAAAVIITCCLAQTIDCYRLRKKERQEGRKGSDSTKVTDVEEGRIVFGRVFKKATGLDAPVIDDTKKPSNASSEDEASYQADFPGKLDCATKQILKVLTLLFLDLKKTLSFRLVWRSTAASEFQRSSMEAHVSLSDVWGGPVEIQRRRTRSFAVCSGQR